MLTFPHLMIKEEIRMKRNQVFFVRNLTLMAALIAMQIILARYLAIQVHEGLRISFETIPLALAGLWLGPVSGVLVALVSDILGTVIYGYGVWFPPIALGPMTFALLCGLAARYWFPDGVAETRNVWKVVVTTVAAGIVNSFGIGLLTTTWYRMLFSSAEGTYPILLAESFIERLTAKPLTIAVSTLLVLLVNKAVYKPVIRPLVRRA